MTTSAASPSLAAKVTRCLSVSVITTGLSLSLLAVLAGPLHVTAWQANVAATAAGTIVSFWLNRRWVWRRSGPSNLAREVLPFWLLSFAGLALSTLAVDRASVLAEHVGLAPGVRAVALIAANAASFGLLWVLQFVLLDRVVFKDPAR